MGEDTLWITDMHRGCGQGDVNMHPICSASVGEGAEGPAPVGNSGPQRRSMTRIFSLPQLGFEPRRWTPRIVC